MHRPRLVRRGASEEAKPVAMGSAVEVHDAIAPVAAEWDDLADRTRGTPFMRPGWLDAWWRTLGHGCGRLEIVALRRGERLAGVLPIVRRRGLVSSTTDDWQFAYDPPAEDEQAARALVDAVLASSPRRVELRHVMHHHPLRAALVAAAIARGYRLVEDEPERAPYVPIDGDWAGYEGRLDRKLRSEVRRRRRRLAELGRLTVDVSDGGERLDELLDEGFALEAAAWKGASGTAITSDAATLEYFRQAARWAQGRGILLLAFLRLDGRPLAFDLCLEEAGVHYLLKIGYDPDFRKYGPGVILRHDMIARAFSEGMSRYEFLGIDLPFKLDWTQEAWEKSWPRAFAPTLAGTIDRLQFTRVRPALRRARRS